MTLLLAAGLSASRLYVLKITYLVDSLIVVSYAILRSTVNPFFHLSACTSLARVLHK